MIIVALIFTACLAAMPVPDGGCILVNGLLGVDEWDDASSVRLDPDTEIRFQKDGKNLFLAIVFLGPHHTGIDLYLQSHGDTRMLHVSTAVGEKVLKDSQWSDITWGQNSWWSANVIGTIVEEGRQKFLKPEAFEFQFDRREFGDDIRLFIHLKRPEKLLPAGASAADSEKWMKLGLK